MFRVLLRAGVVCWLTLLVSAPANALDPINDITSGTASFWFDASDATTLGTMTVGTDVFVDTWANKADPFNNLNDGGNTTRRPILVPNAMNGLPVLRFATGLDGTPNNDMLISEADSGFSGAVPGGITVFSVVNLNTAPRVFSSVVSQSPGSIVGDQRGMSYIVAGAIGGAAGTDHWNPGGNAASVPVGVNTPTTLSWVVPSWSSHQTATQIYYNGVLQSSAPFSLDAPPTLTAGPLRIGNWDQTRSDMVFPGDIAEVLVYSGALNNTDRAAVESYLDQKWVNFAPPPPPPVDPTRVPIVGIDVFDAATQMVDLKRPAGQGLVPSLSIDGNQFTWGSPTPSGNVEPTIIALDLESSHLLRRLRVSKSNATGLGGSDLDGTGDNNDYADLEILVSNDLGPLNLRTYHRVSGLTNGFLGAELLGGEAVVNANGTVSRDNHNPDVDGQFYSLSFSPELATAIALRVVRSPGDDLAFVHYGVYEYEAFAVPEPSTMTLAALAAVGLIAVRRRTRRAT